MRAEGAYQLIEKIGSGSTSEVYAARFASSPLSSFAVKLVRPDLAEGTGYLEALEREAPAAIRFTHSCAAKIFNIERSSDGGALIAMEQIQGVTLFELIKRVKMEDLELPRTIPLWIIAEAARALYAAHKTPWAEGEQIPILHAAISPAALMISRDGEVKVLGIGVGRSELCLPPSQMTVAYRAPELIERTGTDRRADIYSLGVVLSRMMPSLLEENDDVTYILRGMLEKKRGGRPQSLSQVLAVIEPLVSDDAAICTSLAQLVRQLCPAPLKQEELDALVVPDLVTPLPEVDDEALPIEEPEELPDAQAEELPEASPEDLPEEEAEDLPEEEPEVEHEAAMLAQMGSVSKRPVEAIDLPDMTFEEEDSGMEIAPAFEFLGDAQTAQALAAASQPMLADDLIDDVLRMTTGEYDLSAFHAPQPPPAELDIPVSWEPEEPIELDLAPTPTLDPRPSPPEPAKPSIPKELPRMDQSAGAVDISRIALELYAKLAEDGSKSK